MSVGLPEILVILVVALLVLGPAKLPEAARQVGKAMAEFRRVTAGLQAEVRDVFDTTTLDQPFSASPPPPAIEQVPPPGAGAPTAVEQPPAPSSNGSTTTPPSPHHLPDPPAH